MDFLTFSIAALGSTIGVFLALILVNAVAAAVKHASLNLPAPLGLTKNDHAI